MDPILKVISEAHSLTNFISSLSHIFLKFVFSIKFYSKITSSIAAREILLVEDVQTLTYANIPHNLCALKRCLDIAGENL